MALSKWVLFAQPLALVMALSIGSSLAQTLPPDARTTKAGHKSTPSSRGLHIVFDASASMCGYFSRNENNRTLLNLIKKSTTSLDAEAGNRVLLLRQAQPSAVSARDLVEAPANLQAVSEALVESSGSGLRPSRCSPFNGIGSNLELIFDWKAATRSADAIVLVTDAQLEEKDRTKFVQQFRDWARNASGNARPVYAGFASNQVPFWGIYFPVGDPSPDRRKAGYSLDAHSRPLFLFWFARSEKQLATIKDLVGILTLESNKQSPTAIVQHLLPSITSANSRFDQPPIVSGRLTDVLISKPTYDFKKHDPSRSTAILTNCLKTTIGEQQVRVTAANRCQDGKQLYDGVSSVSVTVPLRDNPYTTIRAADNKIHAPGALVWTLSAKDVGEQRFLLQFSPTKARERQVRADLKNVSIDSDYCPEQPSRNSVQRNRDGGVNDQDPNGWQSMCTAKLFGRTYQFDVLSDLMLDRAEGLITEALEPLNRNSYTFVFEVSK